MALSEYTKNLIDEAIKAHFEELAKSDTFTIGDIREYINDLNLENIAPISIKYALERVCAAQNDYILYPHHTKPASYSFHEDKWRLTGEIFKEKNILHFVNGKEKYGDVTYDFITKEWSVPTDEIVHNMGGNFSAIKSVLRNPNRFLKYEWLFNYIKNVDIIYDIICNMKEDDYKVCPNGLIKFLQDTDTEFSYETFKEYILKQTFGVVGYNLMESGLNQSSLDWLIKNDLMKPLIKCLTYNTKSGRLCDSYDVNSLINAWANASVIAQNILPLIETESVKTQIQMFKDIIDRQKNEALARCLQKINFVNGLRKDNLIVVVPQSQEEKRDEGKQQHNCVGYYYDETILQGRNYIYFIRKADAPQKSYVTCRYNVASNGTVEFRGFSNSPVHGSKVRELISEVDRQIRERLK